MKKLLVLPLFILLSQGAFAQAEDTLSHRFGFLMDYAGYLIDNVGLKYRISEPFALTVRMNIFARKADRDLDANYPSSSSSGIAVGLGAEYSVISMYEAALFISLRTEYHFSRSHSQYAPTQITQNTEDRDYDSFSIGPGVGIEYYFTKRLSLSAHQWFQFEWSKSTTTRETSTLNINERQLHISDATLVLTFYL